MGHNPFIVKDFFKNNYSDLESISPVMGDDGKINNWIKTMDANTNERGLIGIDPDVAKSGVGYKNGLNVGLMNYTFFELFDFLKALKNDYKDLLVFVEGGWLNKGNWHKVQKGSSSLNTKIGQRTGANHEVGKKIVEMLEYLEIKHKVVRPTKSKMKAEFFKKLTKITDRTNQEQRDAYMLIHGRK